MIRRLEGVYKETKVGDIRPKLSKHTEVVARMKLAGASNVEIARKLSISDERVRQIWLFYQRRIIRTMEAHERLEEVS